MVWILIKWLLALLVGVALGIIHKKASKTESGLFSVWVETESINEFQTKTLKKYYLYKWVVVKTVTHHTNNDYLNQN